MILSPRVEEYIKRTAKPKFFKEIAEWEISERIMRSNLLYKGLQCSDLIELRLVVQAELSAEKAKERIKATITFEEWKQQVAANIRSYFFCIVDGKSTIMMMNSTDQLKNYKFAYMSTIYPHLIKI